MIHKLVRSMRRAPRILPAIPEGRRLYAIGDVHGRLDLLDRLLTAIDADDAARGPQAETTLVLLGDLVDRGPDSAGVVECMRQYALGGARMRILKGNHEEIFLSALRGDDDALRLFCRIGGRETLLSYGLSPDEYDALDYAELAARMAMIVPGSHIDFLDGFEDMIVLGDYAFVHAGIRPGRPLAEQQPADLRWIRGAFLKARGPFEKRIVHGHTITEDIEYLPHRIGIDTGAYATDRLTALGLEGDTVWHLQT